MNDVDFVWYVLQWGFQNIASMRFANVKFPEHLQTFEIRLNTQH